MCFIAIKCNSSWVDCTESHVCHAPSNTVLNENYLFKQQLGKRTYRPNAFQPQLYFDKHYHSVNHAKNLKWHQQSKCTKSSGTTFIWRACSFDGRDVKVAFKGVILTRICVRENFIAMARIGNVTQNNKIRLIAGNGSEMVWCLHASVLFVGRPY